MSVFCICNISQRVHVAFTKYTPIPPIPVICTVMLPCSYVFFFEKPDPKSGDLLNTEKPKTEMKTNEHQVQPGGRCQAVKLPSKPEKHRQIWLS